MILPEMPASITCIEQYLDNEIYTFENLGKLLYKQHRWLIQQFDNEKIFDMGTKFVMFLPRDTIVELNFNPRYDTLYMFTHSKNTIKRADTDTDFVNIPQFSFGCDYSSALKFTANYELIFRENSVFTEGAYRTKLDDYNLIETFFLTCCMRNSLYLETIVYD